MATHVAANKQTKLSPAISRELKDQKRLEDSRSKATTKSKPAPAPKAVAETNAALNKLGVVREWNEHKELVSFRYKPGQGTPMTFFDLCNQMEKLDTEIKFRESKLAEIKEQIDVALAVAGTEKVEWEGRPVQRITKRAASRVDAQLLLQHSVDPKVILACTVPGAEYSYIQMGKAKKSSTEE